MNRPPRLIARDALERQLDLVDESRMTPSRQRILEAFLKLSAAEGLASVSMRRLGKEVNLKAPSIYAHFETRDEIIVESLRWNFYQFGRALLAAVDETKNVEEFWDAMIRLHFVRQLRLPESNLWDLIVATDRSVHTLPDGLRSELNSLEESYEAMYGGAAAEMGVANARPRIPLIMTLLEGATRWCSPEVDDSDLKQATQLAIAASRALLFLDATEVQSGSGLSNHQMPFSKVP